jgi:hypothetical protein
MKCIRCGYCCIHYDVIIVADPKLGIQEDNIHHKPSGVKCPHLTGDVPGEYTCAVHNEPWYKETPCYDFGQIEESENDICRIGKYFMEK